MAGDDTAKRIDVTFGAPGDECAAWWYTPAGVAGPYAAVVMAHGFGGVREARLDAFAERFVDAGLAVLVFDYRNFGASSGSPRQVLDIDKQLADWRAALAYVRGRADVDASRVALWGTSFAGGHVLATAAREPDLAAVVSQVPFVDGLANLTYARIRPRTAAGLVAAAVADSAAALVGLPPVLVPVVGSPGSVAVMTTPDALDGYRALVPDPDAFDDRVAARVVLRVPAYRPGVDAGSIECPLLVCVADTDSVASPEAASAVAGRAPLGELLRYPCGHFDVYVGEWFERAVTDETAFLTRHLGVANG
ncbi:MAG: alpha/beta hydrolase [Acidimicrobiia bacterium]|nr:alpha/beta hydrolase [Acidimicrobiia bacterium]